MSKVILSVATAAILLSPCAAQGQGALKSVMEKIQVRQSFAAATQETKPASFLWTVEEEPGEAEFATIDLAVRYPLEKHVGIGNLIAGPTAEWHKLTREGKAADKVMVGGSGELVVSGIRVPWFGSPYLSGDLGVERDRELNETGLSYSAAVTFRSNSEFAPGDASDLWKGSFLRYYVWVAVEQHANVTDEISDATVGLLRMNVEFFPFGGVQLLGSYSWADELGSDDLPSDLDRRTASINVYLDSEERFAVGVDYVNGSVPKEAFGQVERAVFGFKVKF